MERTDSSSPPTTKKYFIGSLPGLLEEDQLQEYLSSFGQVHHLEIVLKKRTKVCRGYAFLSIALSVPEADFLGRPHEFRGRSIYVRSHVQGNMLQHLKQDIAARRLFINNLPRSVTSYDLKYYFQQYGDVELAYISPNFRAKKVKSFLGFINFNDEESLKRVLNEPLHMIKGLTLNCMPFHCKLRSAVREASSGSITNLDLPTKRETSMLPQIKEAGPRLKKSQEPMLTTASYAGGVPTGKAQEPKEASRWRQQGRAELASRKTTDRSKREERKTERPIEEVQAIGKSIMNQPVQWYERRPRFTTSPLPPRTLYDEFLFSSNRIVLSHLLHQHLLLNLSPA